MNTSRLLTTGITALSLLLAGVVLVPRFTATVSSRYGRNHAIKQLGSRIDDLAVSLFTPRDSSDSVQTVSMSNEECDALYRQFATSFLDQFQRTRGDLCYVGKWHGLEITEARVSRDIRNVRIESTTVTTPLLGATAGEVIGRLDVKNPDGNWVRHRFTFKTDPGAKTIAFNDEDDREELKRLSQDP